MNDWAIEVTDTGTFDVTNGSRPVEYDRETLEEAVDVVRRAGGLEYTLIEADGYRTIEKVR